MEFLKICQWKTCMKNTSTSHVGSIHRQINNTMTTKRLSTLLFYGMYCIVTKEKAFFEDQIMVDWTNQGSFY